MAGAVRSSFIQNGTTVIIQNIPLPRDNRSVKEGKPKYSSRNQLSQCCELILRDYRKRYHNITFIVAALHSYAESLVVVLFLKSLIGVEGFLLLYLVDYFEHIAKIRERL